MASKFFEKNKAKRKGLLALLLLLLRSRKAVIPLLVVLLLMLAFLAPKKTGPLFFRALEGVPFVGHKLSKGAQRFAMFTPREEGAYDGGASLSAAFRAAREKGTKAWNLFGGASSASTAQAVRTADSVGMVRGSREQMFAGKATKSGVTGIASREAGTRVEAGVQLHESDLTGERAQYYEAGMGGLFGIGGAGRTGLLEGAEMAGPTENAQSAAFVQGVGAYVKADFFKGPGKVSNKVDHLTTALDYTKVPQAQNAVQAQNQGRISSYRPQDAAGRASARNNNPIRGGRALRQLAEGRARAMVARETVDGKPMCAASNGCPPEYAAVNIGAVYDGWHINNGQFIQASGMAGATPEVDGVSVPNVNIPTDGELQQYIDEANQINTDAEQCRQADDMYQPLEDEALARYLQARQNACARGCRRQDDSIRFHQQGQSYDSSFLSCLFSLGRNCGGYAAARDYEWSCRDLVRSVEQQCDAIDQLRYQHYMACPTRRAENNFQYRCNVPPEAGGYNIPSC